MLFFWIMTMLQLSYCFLGLSVGGNENDSGAPTKFRSDFTVSRVDSLKSVNEYEIGSRSVFYVMDFERKRKAWALLLLEEEEEEEILRLVN